MKKSFICTALACTTLLSACTTPADVSQPLTAGNNENAKFEIKNTATGFTVDLQYSRYQFVPAPDALLAECRSIVTSRAYDEAKSKEREIQQIGEQEIRVSAGRNILNGRTTCRAFVEAIWKS